MSLVLRIAQWVETTQISEAIRGSTWSYPIIESAHVLGLCLFLGFAMLWDLRLLNITLRRVPISEMQARVMPWTNLGFVIMAISGGLLVWSDPLRFYDNLFFRVKLVALVVAGLNAGIFHFFTAGKRLVEWDSSPVSPMSARVAGTFSLFLWAIIVICGRFIAYMDFGHMVEEWLGLR